MTRGGDPERPNNPADPPGPPLRPHSHSTLAPPSIHESSPEPSTYSTTHEEMQPHRPGRDDLEAFHSLALLACTSTSTVTNTATANNTITSNNSTDCIGEPEAKGSLGNSSPVRHVREQFDTVCETRGYDMPCSPLQLDD